MAYSTPGSVLHAIAKTCGCRVDDIEVTLENLHTAAKPIPRKADPEERLDVIRAWLETPEGGSVIEYAADYVLASLFCNRRNRVQ